MVQSVWQIKVKSRHYIYKIGFTIDNPISRAQKLSSDTGILADFDVEYSLKFSNYKLAEKIVHEKLKKYRVRSDREFFKVDLNKAIEIIKDAFSFLENRDQKLKSSIKKNYEKIIFKPN